MGILRHLAFFLAMTTVAGQGYGQSTLSGKLTNRQTGEPVPFANIYFANTTLGSSSLADGTYTINRIPTGKYDLLIEIIGFRRHRQAIEFVEGDYYLDVPLDQDTVELRPVTVVAESDKKYLPLFIHQFVGDDSRAKKCTILNPEDLYLYFDSVSSNLTVTARQAIQILNPDLGYKVYFTLDKFELDFKANSKRMEGIARFEDLPSSSRKDSTKRDKNRAAAYRGSLFHFTRSLFKGSLKQEDFVLFVVDSVREPGSGASMEVLVPFEFDKGVSGSQVKSLNFRGLLKLVYRHGEAFGYPDRWRRSNPEGFQQTYLLLKDPLQIYENGYYAEPASVFMTGYLMWRETIANMLPLGYEPLKQKSRR